jgi:hypothetical protein
MEGEKELDARAGRDGLRFSFSFLSFFFKSFFQVPALPEAHIDICASSKSTTETHLDPPKIPEAHINKMRLK